MDIRRVRDRREEINIFDLFDRYDISEVKEQLSKLESLVDLSVGETARFSVEPYEYGDGVDVFLDIYRDETSEEIKARMAEEYRKRERARKAIKAHTERVLEDQRRLEEFEREEYERLRKKFEKK